MDTESVYISVRGGSTDRPEVELRVGTPVEAFSVGSSASWKVNGAGIGGTHAYLFFDGRTLFVACAPGAIVKLQGAVVSTDWRPVTVPAEIDLGGVVLSVTPQRGGAPSGRSGGRTVPPPQRSGGGRRPLPSASGVPAARQPAQQRPRLQEMPHGGQSTAPQYARPPGAQAAAAQPHPSSPQHAPPQQTAPHTQQSAPQRAPNTLQSASPWQQQQPRDEPQPLTQPLPAAGRPAAHEPEFEEDDMPTQFQAAPGFEALEEDDPESRTMVQDPGELLAAARRPEHAVKLERPKPPSIPPPPSGGDATVVRPLEEYLAESGGLAGGYAEPNRPMPAAGQPASGAQGVYIQPPEPTMPPTGEAIWAARQAMAARGIEPPPGMPEGSPPQAWGQQPGMQDPNMPQGQWGQPQPGMYSPQQGMPGAPAAPGAKPSFLQKFRALPRSRKLVYAALPICMLAFIVIFEEDEPVQPAELAPSASAPLASASAPAVPSVAPTAANEVVDAAIAPVDAGVTVPVDAAAPPEKPKLAPGEVTKDRAAVDAVASGDFPKALKLYKELATENPKNEAYRRAVEILERRTRAAP